MRGWRERCRSTIHISSPTGYAEYPVSPGLPSDSRYRSIDTFSIREKYQPFVITRASTFLDISGSPPLLLLSLNFILILALALFILLLSSSSYRLRALFTLRWTREGRTVILSLSLGRCVPRVRVSRRVLSLSLSRSDETFLTNRKKGWTTLRTIFEFVTFYSDFCTMTNVPNDKDRSRRIIIFGQESFRSKSPSSCVLPS